MTLPEIWELFRYWGELPPSVEILYSRYDIQPKRSEEPVGRSTAEDAKAVRALAGGQSKSFDQLPLSVQQRLLAMRKSSGK